VSDRSHNSTPPDDRPSASDPGERPVDDPPPRIVSSESLLAGATQLAIRHNQTLYFLRQTRFGKLILTK
jgi:hemin uptake protein HemP